MGGLSKKIKYTYWTMLIATLAIAGIPPLAGFFSKDAILLSAFLIPGGHPLYAVGLLTALLTSFYMFRLLFLTFFGKPRYDEHKVHVHESPRSMTVPLIILAILSVCGGWVAAPHLVGGTDHFEKLLHPVFSTYAPSNTLDQLNLKLESAGLPHVRVVDLNLTPWPPETRVAALVKSLLGWPVIVALIGFLLAWWFYIKDVTAPKKLARSLHGLYTLLLNKYYVDEIYGALIIRPLLWISTNVLWHGVDSGVIDGVVNGTARVAQSSGGEVRELQSGNARSYASWVVIGALGFTVLLIGLWWKVR
jgi:NADH-quinone oxidoreductase subunit L